MIETKLRRIYIEGLFGQFTHNIPVNLDNEITIIHGPNGYGKTTVLKLTVDILKGRVMEPKLVPFSKFQLEFDDGSLIEVSKTGGISPNGFKTEAMVYNFFGANGERDSYVPKAEKDRQVPLSMLDDEWPFLRRVGHRLWEDRSSGQVLDYDDVMETYGEVQNAADLPPWIRRLQHDIPTHLISADRLHMVSKAKEIDRGYHRREVMIPSVTLYSQQISQALESKLAESAALSQELDRTFPNRLIQRMVHFDADNTPSEEIVDKKLEELENRRLRLAKVGLLDNYDNPPVEPKEVLDPHTRSVLALYIEDTEKKLSIYDNLEAKINLFMRIVNRRFSNKRVTVDRKSGFAIALSDGTLLRPELLSSGEQHELVLTYDLLFRTERGSLVMLDEPEISLHIAWQQEFLADMIDIAKLTGTHVVIATHSPDIISGRWDLTVGLGEAAK